MARYIDADAFLKKIERFSLSNGTTLGKHSGVADEIIDILIAEPTADVAECIHITEDMIKGHCDPVGERGEDGLLHIKQEVAREIFEEIENKFYYDDVGDFTIDHMDFQALKKKYTKEGE